LQPLAASCCPFPGQDAPGLACPSCPHDLPYLGMLLHTLVGAFLPVVDARPPLFPGDGSLAPLGEAELRAAFHSLSVSLGCVSRCLDQLSCGPSQVLCLVADG